MPVYPGFHRRMIVIQEIPRPKTRSYQAALDDQHEILNSFGAIGNHKLTSSWPAATTGCSNRMSPKASWKYVIPSVWIFADTRPALNKPLVAFCVLYGELDFIFQIYLIHDGGICKTYSLRCHWSFDSYLGGFMKILSPSLSSPVFPLAANFNSPLSLVHKS